MLQVMALAAVERIINVALATDPITQDGLKPLSGKVLRVNISAPQLSVDVLFCDDHIRFEPVSRSPFEPQGMVAAAEPDCAITADNPRHLLKLAMNPSGNLPVRGDHRLLMAVQRLADGFTPDVWMKLESLLGANAVSYLHLFSQEIKPAVLPLISPLTGMLKDIATGISGASSGSQAHHGELDQALLAKKQQLLALQGDIERETVRLNQLKQQSAELINNNADTDAPLPTP